MMDTDEEIARLQAEIKRLTRCPDCKGEGGFRCSAPGSEP